MDYVTLLGYTATFFVTIALFPQVYKSWKTKKVADISYGWITNLTIGFSLFLVYGLIIKDGPIVVTNTVSLAQILTMLGLKVKYSRK